jgi:hypothetical protein
MGYLRFFLCLALVVRKKFHEIFSNEPRRHGTQFIHHHCTRQHVRIFSEKHLTLKTKLLLSMLPVIPFASLLKLPFRFSLVCEKIFFHVHVHVYKQKDEKM